MCSWKNHETFPSIPSSLEKYKQFISRVAPKEASFGLSCLPTPWVWNYPSNCLVDSKLIRWPPTSENLGNLRKCSLLSVNAPVIQTSWTGISAVLCIRNWENIPFDLSKEAAFGDQLLTFSFPADPIPLSLPLVLCAAPVRDVSRFSPSCTISPCDGFLS